MGVSSRLAELQRVRKASLLYIERSSSQILSVMENAGTKNSLASNNAQENGVPFLSTMGSCFGWTCSLEVKQPHFTGLER